MASPLRDVRPSSAQLHVTTPKDAISSILSPPSEERLSFSQLNMNSPRDTASRGRSVSSEGRSSPSSSSTSSRSSFVKIPPGGRFIINEELLKLPFNFIPLRFNGRESKYFQPREKELQQIRSCIFPSQNDPFSPNSRSFLISGLGGVGKTELAFRFVNESREHFDAIFFLIADSESRLSEQYSTIACDLGLIEPSDKNNQELCSETFRTWLGDPVKGAPQAQEAKVLIKWLLVFDNAESIDVIQKFWPGPGHGSILLTSRNPLLASSELNIDRAIQLEGLSTDDGARLLRIQAKDTEPDDLRTEADSKAIVEWVQGLPMAIDQLGRIIYNDRLSVSQFRKFYRTKSDVYSRLYKGHRTDENLGTAWALNWMYDRQKDTFALLSLVSLLDPESIDHRILKPRPQSLNTKTISDYLT